MGMATVGLVLGCLFATPLAHALRLGDDPWLVRAGAVGLWAQMNYSQLTNLFRVEERSVQFVIASMANILITVGMTVLLVVGLHKGATGAVVGNFLGTLSVYLVLLAYRRCGRSTSSTGCSSTRTRVSPRRASTHSRFARRA
jgi:O-antigen/teichoic acid export membrane protein